MPTRFANPVPQFTDNAGDPLLSGVMDFFENTTEIRKDTFKDVNLKIKNENPVPLSANGRMPNCFYNGTARAVLRDDSGQVWAKDGVGQFGSGSTFDTYSSIIEYEDQALVVASDEEYYRSLQNNNIGNDPTSAASFWEMLEFIRTYNANVTYSVGDISKASDGKIYSSLQNSNTGNDPLSSPTFWENAIGNPFDQSLNVADDVEFDNLTATTSIIADTIIEKTAAAGVNVDGVVLKDGGGTFTGNVGIGGSPSFPLHIQGTGAIEGRLESSTASNITSRFKNATRQTRFNLDASGNFSYHDDTAGTVPFSINTSGHGTFRNRVFAGSDTLGATQNGYYASGTAGQFPVLRVGEDSNNFSTLQWDVNNSIVSLVYKAAGTQDSIFQVGTSRNLQIFRNTTFSSDVSITGALSKGSDSFRIDHPLKPDTHQLVHSFTESPQADLYYRGSTTLIAGRAVINIDEDTGMTDGTFVALCRNVQCFTSNETDWTEVRGTVNGNTLTIEARNVASTATVSWLLIGERQDQHMYDTDWTNDNGRVIVEPEKDLENA